VVRFQDQEEEEEEEEEQRRRSYGAQSKMSV